MNFKIPSLFTFYESPPLDPDSKLLNVEVKENSNIFLKYLSSTSLTVSYLNNNLFKQIKENGSFILIINSKDPKGPNGIYCISRSNSSSSGTIKPLVESKGMNGEFLELEWNPYEFPKLNIVLTNNKHKRLSFYVKIISSF